MQLIGKPTHTTQVTLKYCASSHHWLTSFPSNPCNRLQFKANVSILCQASVIYLQAVFYPLTEITKWKQGLERVGKDKSHISII